jgi:hypothetical protein|tara:strand:+ start:1669 stop:2253 length:585 start_codon:yes stop_codon:yes gene_type:complete
MKKLLIITILSMILFSCKKEDMDSQSSGGGTSQNCDNVVCLNDGYCILGDCICPDGWSGDNCGQEVTPSSMRWYTLKVLSHPATDNGAGWDLTSTADIYIEVSLNGSVIYSSPTYYPNALPGNTYTFTPDNYIYIANPTATYIVRLYDLDDIGLDDYIGGYSFTPYVTGTSFPSTRIIGSGNALTFELVNNFYW